MCITSIGCDGCNSRHHPTHVCLGILDSIINTINEYGFRGINFCCTSCKLEGEVVVMGHNLAVLLMVVEVWMVVSVSRI